jgi:glycosyltransferase involved in cell wall biosynthesis
MSVRRLPAWAMSPAPRDPALRAAAARRPRLLIVQPCLTAYRLPVYAEMARECDVYLASSPPQQDAGFGAPAIEGTGIREHFLVPEKKLAGGRLLWQGGLLRILAAVRPDKVLCAANPRALSFWLLMLACRLRGIEVYAHGQGAYGRRTLSTMRRWMYRLLVALSSRYLCYTESVRSSLLGAVDERKLAVVANSLEIRESLPPEHKTWAEPGVLFLGRLRAGSQLDLLIDAAASVRSRCANLVLHIVGAGPEEKALRQRYGALDWVQWHGAVYDEARVREISRACGVGCYPGHAGLSVVHYMALSLVPVVHDCLELHMGPEPSYVRSGENGLSFQLARSVDSLAQVLQAALTDRALRQRLATASHDTYLELTRPALSRRFLHAMRLDAVEA